MSAAVSRFSEAIGPKDEAHLNEGTKPKKNWITNAMERNSVDRNMKVNWQNKNEVDGDQEQNLSPNGSKEKTERQDDLEDPREENDLELMGNKERNCIHIREGIKEVNKPRKNQNHLQEQQLDHWSKEDLLESILREIVVLLVLERNITAGR